MHVHEYAAQDATGLAQLVRDKEVSADEVYAAALAAIAEVNPTINAITNGPWERPLDHAADGPFAGVPFGLKDELGCHAAGVRYRCGSRLTGDGIAFPHDTYLMQKFREAGLATAAVMAVPEFSTSTNCTTVVHGTTRNPWDTNRSTGGSSGGTAAIVASGALPICHGSDGGGSIRVPAAWNGLVGLKPNRGRVSPGPDSQDSAAGLSHEFVMTRSVRDCAAMLDVVAGAMPGDAMVLQRPDRPWRDEVGAPPGHLRVAVCTEAFSGVTDPDVVAVVERVAHTLEELGHHVEPAKPVLDWDSFIGGFVPMGGLAMYGLVKAVSAMSGLAPGPDTLEAASLAAYQLGTTVTVDEILAFGLPINAICQLMGAFFLEWDLLLTPTTQIAAPPLDLLDNNARDVNFEDWMRMMFERFSSFTPIANVTGAPAITLPLGQTPEGLPVGVQLAGRVCDEAGLLRVAAQLEAAMPWSARRPAVYAGTEG